MFWIVTEFFLVLYYVVGVLLPNSRGHNPNDTFWKIFFLFNAIYFVIGFFVKNTKEIYSDGNIISITRYNFYGKEKITKIPKEELSIKIFPTLRSSYKQIFVYQKSKIVLTIKEGSVSKNAYKSAFELLQPFVL
jgi:hypothetical protein